MYGYFAVAKVLRDAELEPVNISITKHKKYLCNVQCSICSKAYWTRNCQIMMQMESQMGASAHSHIRWSAFNPSTWNLSQLHNLHTTYVKSPMTSLQRTNFLNVFRLELGDPTKNSCSACSTVSDDIVISFWCNYTHIPSDQRAYPHSDKGKKVQNSSSFNREIISWAIPTGTVGLSFNVPQTYWLMQQWIYLNKKVLTIHQCSVFVSVI